MLSVDEALTIVLDLAREGRMFADDITTNEKSAIDLVTAFQLLNLRGKPFPLSNGKPKRRPNQCQR